MRIINLIIPNSCKISILHLKNCIFTLLLPELLEVLRYHKHARVSLPGGEHDKYTKLYDDDEKENEATTRTNFFGEENVAVVSVVMACQAGGSRRKEKEEVVNVEKSRRNLKRRCIDSNRRLSYSPLISRARPDWIDIRRYCPAIPPPPFTPSALYAHKSAPLLREVSTLAAPYFFSSSYVHTLSSLGGKRMRADVWAVWSLDGGRCLQKCRERTVICVATLIPEDRNLEIQRKKSLNSESVRTS